MMSIEEKCMVYVIIPTHNRVLSLKNILTLLSIQTYQNICVIVIDDGSVDGSHEYLKQQSHKKMVVLRGDGKLWWGGAVAIGMDRALSMAADDDYLLLLNDDSTFDQNYIEDIVEDSRAKNYATMVSPQYDSFSKSLSFVGYQVDYHRQSITQVKTEPVDAAVGRGLLIPVGVVKKIGTINAKKFPHYMADIEFTVRIKDHKYPLEVAWSAPIYTDLTPSDLHVQSLGVVKSRFHRRSKSNVFDKLKFFHCRGPVWSRLSAIPILIYQLGRSLLRRTIIQ